MNPGPWVRTGEWSWEKLPRGCVPEVSQEGCVGVRQTKGRGGIRHFRQRELSVQRHGVLKELHEVNSSVPPQCKG